MPDELMDKMCTNFVNEWIQEGEGPRESAVV